MTELGKGLYNYKDFSKIYFDFIWNWNDFVIKYNFAVNHAALQAYLSFISKENKPTKAKKIENVLGASFDSNLRESLKQDNFVLTFENFIESFVEVVGLTRHNIAHKYFDDFYVILNFFIYPFRDSINRTPSEMIKIESKFGLLHYKSSIPIRHKIPILVVGSLINRYYILDLLPNISIIKKLLENGFDVYATDWRTPNSFDKDMTLENYAHEYVEKAVDKVREINGSEKVSIFGYC